MNRIVAVFKKYQSYIFCAAIVALLILICIPLFVVAKYNYMSSDDFAYGAITYHAIQDGQPWKIFGLAAAQVLEIYQSWQGSFSAIFLFALQPGIWGEQYYQLGTYIIMASLMFMQFIWIRRLLGKGPERIKPTHLVSLCALLYLCQIFYVPYPEECFYWFNGSLYYSFFYSLQMLLFSEVLVVLRFPEQLKVRHWLFFVWMLLLSAVIGGGNLATGLATAFALCLLVLALFVKKNPRRFYILTITVVFLAAFAINIVAPGNDIRGQDPGYHPVSPIATVVLAAWHCLINIYSWTGLKMWLILLMAAPLLWKIARIVNINWKFTFRFPGIATILFFGIYASQMAPITYMSGDYFGPKRLGDIMWFSYVLLMFVWEGYWIGWLRCRFGEFKFLNKIKLFISARYGILQLSCLALWCVMVLLTNVKSSSTYIAWAAVRSGEAQKYAAENEERLRVLRDPEIVDVYFYEIKHGVLPIFVYDISENNQDQTNTSMANFYRKKTVNLIGD